MARSVYFMGDEVLAIAGRAEERQIPGKSRHIPNEGETVLLYVPGGAKSFVIKRIMGDRSGTAYHPLQQFFIELGEQ